MPSSCPGSCQGNVHACAEIMSKHLPSYVHECAKIMSRIVSRPCPSLCQEHFQACDKVMSKLVLRSCPNPSKVMSKLVPRSCHVLAYAKDMSELLPRLCPCLWQGHIRVCAKTMTNLVLRSYPSLCQCQDKAVNVMSKLVRRSAMLVTRSFLSSVNVIMLVPRPCPSSCQGHLLLLLR